MKKLIAVFAAILVAAAVVRAESGGVVNDKVTHAQSYLIDHTTGSFRPTTSSIDSLTTSKVLNTPSFDLFDSLNNTIDNAFNIRKNIGVSARFQAAAATCQVQLAYCSWNGSTEVIATWSTVITLTASSVLHESAYYESPEFTFPSNGAIRVRILLTTTASTAGNQTTLWARSW